MLNNISGNRDIIKDLIKELFNLTENFEFKFFNNSFEENSYLTAIDGGNNFFNNPLLQFFGTSYVSVIAFNDSFIDKKEFILFDKCSLDLKRKQIKQIEELEVFGSSNKILELIGEKDYNNEQIEEENSFSLKIRNLLELAYLIKYSKSSLVVRDGLFYLPDLINLKEIFLKKVKQANIFSLAKKSKILRDFSLNSFLIKLEKQNRKNKSLIVKINKDLLSKYYEDKFLINSKHFVFSYSPLSYYHLEIPYEAEIKEVVKVLVNESRKGKKGYPKSLIMADKLVKASNNVLRKYENLVLKIFLENLDENIKENLFLINKKFQIRK